MARKKWPQNRNYAHLRMLISGFSPAKELGSRANKKISGYNRIRVDGGKKVSGYGKKLKLDFLAAVFDCFQHRLGGEWGPERN